MLNIWHYWSCLFVGQFSAFWVEIEVSKPAGPFYGSIIKQMNSEIFGKRPRKYQGLFQMKISNVFQKPENENEIKYIIHLCIIIFFLFINFFDFLNSIWRHYKLNFFVGYAGALPITLSILIVPSQPGWKIIKISTRRR